MLVPMRAILEAADKYHYGQAAFNMNSVGQVQAAIRIHELLDSAAILQGAEASNAYLGGAADFMHGSLEEKTRGAKTLGDAVKRFGADSPIPISLHLDHGKSLEIVKACIAGGYTSVMIDGSNLPYADNVELTREVVKYAHPYGVTVEGELGVLAGVEDHVFSRSSTYTNPLQAVDFFKKTGCDTLAISYGTCHGPNKGKDTHIRREIAIATKECMRHEGIRGFLVSHGSSTVPPEFVSGINALGGQLENAFGIEVAQLVDVARCGINKINVDSAIYIVGAEDPGYARGMGLKTRATFEEALEDAQKKYVGYSPNILALPLTFKTTSVHLCMKNPAQDCMDEYGHHPGGGCG